MRRRRPGGAAETDGVGSGGAVAAARHQADAADRQADRGRAGGAARVGYVERDPKLAAQLDGVAKKNGFASYDEYRNVVDNITIVLTGFDYVTKKYVGPRAVIRAQIAEVRTDKKMSARDKKKALADLNDALKSPAPPIENKGTLELVEKYYDKLADALDDDEE
jgi:hypothetical protein